MSLAEQLDAIETESAASNRPKAPHEATSAKWHLTEDSDGASIETGALPEKIVNWDGILLHFGLDPDVFEVVEDTVRMSSWQQSKRLENGDRDEIWLYSYKARFRRVSNRLPESDLEELRKTVKKWRPSNRRIPGTGLGAPSTFYGGWADWQLGSNAGGGVAGTTQRILDSFEMQANRVKELRKIGRNLTSGAVWNMGDPTEGCDSNYASQLFSVELTRREQLNLALDLWWTGLKIMAPLFEDFEFGSVLCNHGEWGRQGFGTKQVTPDSDNIGGYLADTLKRITSERSDMDHVRFNIPDDELYQLSVLSGVPVGFTHGHKLNAGTPAKEKELLTAQSIRMLREQGTEPRLWLTAHRHHVDVKDYGAFYRVQHPSMDYGSKWLADMNGTWSSAGTFTCLIGEHEQAGGPLSGVGRGFSDELILVAQ